jgi:hypothetical protein
MTDPPASYPRDVRESFEYCVECESLVVSVDQHTCTAGRASGKPSAAERAQLAAADQRPLDEDVLIPAGRSQHNAWAYHELDDAGDPLHELNHRAGAETGAREEAITSNCYPCGQCRLIQERRSDDA